MRLILTDELKEFMVLGKSIYDEDGRLLLSAGYRLKSDFIPKLLKRGYSYIYIFEEGTEEVIPEDIISTEITIQAKSRLNKKTSEVQSYLKLRSLNKKKFSALMKSGYLRRVNITSDMLNVAEEILVDISYAGAKIMNTIMMKSENYYNIDHAVNCTILAILIGKQFRFSKPELLKLALGTYLHDFGKVVLEKIRKSSITNMADDFMVEHPTFGYLIIRNSKDALPETFKIILQHHENQDGSGFPAGLIGQNIPPVKNVERKYRGHISRFAEICSVANAYDNLLMNPLDIKKLTPTEAIRKMIADSCTLYNKHIVNALFNIIALYPVGVKVKIIDSSKLSIVGYVGVVAEINEKNRNKPKIILLYNRSMKRITPEKIDTSKFKDVKIEVCY